MKKSGAALVFIAAVAFLVFLWRESAPESASDSNQAGGPADRRSEIATPKSPAKLSETALSAPAGTYFSAGSSAISASEIQKAFVRSKIISAPPPTMPELTNIPAAAVLENMRGVFKQYAGRFGSNPVGTNPEITASLNGGNPKQVQFLNPEDGLRINESGELVDSWGTPFFFHQLSARDMEIHSAGPDRVMWTADDLVTK
jgi:hypothetical protein